MKQWIKIITLLLMMFTFSNLDTLAVTSDVTSTTMEAPETEVPETTEAPKTEVPETTEAPETKVPETAEAPKTKVPETAEAPKNELSVTKGDPKNEVPATTEAPKNELSVTKGDPKNNVATTEATQEVKILHTNDIHGRLEEEKGRVIGMSKLKGVKAQEKPDLLLDAGDAFQGLPISNFSKGEDMAKAMNAVGYDAMTVGNHEFDFGFDQLMKLKNQLNFPMLTTNVQKDGKNVFEGSKIINKNGIRFGIVGVTTPETATKTHPNNIKGVTFLDPVTTVTNEMQRIINDVDIFVVLSHLGIDTTTKEEWRGDYLMNQLAANPLFNLFSIFVIDGHSHSVIENGKVKDNVLLAQTGTALSNIGKITFNYKDREVTNKQASMIHLNEVTVDSDQNVDNIIQLAKDNFGSATSEVVFNNPVFLNGEREFVRTQETNLGNVITDAMEAYSKNGFKRPGDFAITNGGGIRASIDPKEATLGDIIKVLPFGNTITQIEVQGKDVLAMFEHSLSAPTVDKDGLKLDANGAFLHVSSSIKVYYDLMKEPGSRVYKIEILNKETGMFERLNLEKTYRVVTNDFLAVGGDGYTMLGGPREEGPSLDTVVANWLKQADLSNYTNGISRIIAGTEVVELPIEDDEDTLETTEPVVEDDHKEPIEDIETTEEKITDDTKKNNKVIKEVAEHLQTGGNVKTPVEMTSSNGKVIPFKSVNKEVKSILPQNTNNDEQLPITGEHNSTPYAAGGLLIVGAYVLYRTRKSA